MDEDALKEWNKRYVEFNNMIYPTSWFKYKINLRELDYENLKDVYTWAIESKIPYIIDEVNPNVAYLMSEEDVMALKLRWI